MQSYGEKRRTTRAAFAVLGIVAALGLAGQAAYATKYGPYYGWDSSTLYKISSIPVAYVSCDQTGWTDTTVDNCDECWGGYSLGFSFRFYGNSYSSINISSNGYFSFDMSQSGDPYNGGGTLPSTSTYPPSVIALFGADLDGGSSGQINYRVTGSAPNRIWWCGFHSVDYYNSNEDVEALLMLYETTNIIEMHYGNEDDSSPNTDKSGGIQNGARNQGFLQWQCTGTDEPNDQWAVRYDPNPVPLSLTRMDGSSASAGANVRWQMVFDRAVSNVLAGDFALGGTASGSITGVTGSGTTYTITVATTACDDGDLTLTLNDSDQSINAQNTGHLFQTLTGETYAISLPPVPGAPTAPTPADGTMCPLTQQLSWTNGANTTSTQISFNGGAFAAASSPYNPGTLTAGATYTWQVRAVGGCSQTTTGPLWSFTAVSPPAPTLVSPAAGATCVAISPTLSWTSAPTGGPVDQFILYFGPQGSLSSLGAQTSPYTVAGPLLNNTIYEWYVQAVGPGGTVSTAHRMFRTITAPPSAPNTPTPADNATNVPLTQKLSWVNGSGTSSTEISFNGGAFVSATSPYTPPTLVMGQTYTWQIRATNACGAQTTGPLWHFSSLNNLAPTDISPNSLTVNDGDPNGTAFGTLTVTDTWITTPYTWSVTGGSTAFAFGTPSGNTVPVLVGNTALIDRANGPALSISVRVTDGGGLYYTELITINVVDSTPPNITACPSNRTITGLPGQCTVALPNLTGELTATDNVSPAGTLTITQDPMAGTPLGFGDTVVTFFAADQLDNESSCHATITVHPDDNTPPTIDVCAQNQSVDATLGGCSAIVPDFTAGVTASDDCDDAVTITQSPAAGETASVGVNTITITAEDNSGNTDTCEATLTVNDVEEPVIACPAAFTIPTNPGQCGASVPSVTTMVTASDLCGTVSLSQSPLAAAAVSTGLFTVTVTAEDEAGNTAECTVDITVTDQEAPVISAPAHANVALNAVFTDPGAAATDNCGVSATPVGVVVAGDASFNTSANGNTWTIEYSVSDDAGNPATPVRTVFTVVTDITPPVINGVDAPLSMACGSTMSLGAALIGVTAQDPEEGTVSVSVDFAGLPQYLSPETDPYTIEYSAHDSLGNTTTRTRTVQVQDNCALAVTPIGKTKVTALENEEVTLAVNVTGAVGGSSIQWLFESAAKAPEVIPDANAAEYTFTLTAASAGTYYAEASDAVTSVRSEAFKVSIGAGVPVTGGLGLMAASGLLALAGALLSKRRGVSR